MKSAYISLIIFVAMTAAIIFSINYLNRVSSNLEKLNDKMEQYISDDKWNEAYQTSLEYTKLWKSYSKTIKLFVNHQEIDNIEMELWKLPQYVKEKTKDEALASVHVLKFLSNHISDLEKVNIQNIM